MKNLPVILTVIFLGILTFFTVYSAKNKYDDLPIATLTTISAGEINSTSYDNVVSLMAVHTDLNERDYIFLANQKDGAWGKEYFCTRKYVGVLDEDNINASLKMIDKLETPIVLYANQELVDGCQVKLMEGS